MARATYLPCTVRHATNTITLEVTSTLLPVPGCKLLRVDAVKGTVVGLYGGNTLEVVWQGGKHATYTTVKFGAVI